MCQLTISSLIDEQDPPKEERQEGHPVLLDGVRRLRNRYVYVKALSTRDSGETSTQQYEREL